MPSYAKFMKQIFSKKKKPKEFQTVVLNEECSAILQCKMPPKLKDLEQFFIPCSVGLNFSSNTLCNLGARINLMPLCTYDLLGLGETKPTTVKLQLANRSYIFPYGEIENVLVKVDKFTLPVHFVVIDIEDKDVPLIMGRPFLSIGRTIIDVIIGELIMRVYDESRVIKVFELSEYLDDILA